MNPHAAGGGYPTTIGNAVTCGHHTHSDRQFMECLARAWGMTVPQLRVTFLAMLFSDAEHELITPAAASRLPAVRLMTAAELAPETPALAKRDGGKGRRSTRTVGTPKQRAPVVQELLRRNPHASGTQVQEALAAAGFHVSSSCAGNDLQAARGIAPRP